MRCRRLELLLLLLAVFPNSLRSAPAKFTLSGSPSSQSVAQGQTASYAITVSPDKSFNAAVTFSVAGLPANATANFNPTSVSGPGSTTMTVSTASNTPLGTSTLTVTGVGGNSTNTTTVSLTVSQAYGTVAGKVTDTNGTTPLPGATVDIYQNAAKTATATSNATGDYAVPNLLPGAYTLMCTSTGRKVYIQSAIAVNRLATTTVNVSLPLAPSVSASSKEYIRYGSNLLAIEAGSDGPRKVDFEQFTGSNYGGVALPPLVVGLATFSGGQIIPLPVNTPADMTVYYWTANIFPPGYNCLGCAGTITIDFAQPVFNVSVRVLNGNISTVNYTVQDDKGWAQTVTLPSNWNSGAALVSSPNSGIRRLTVSGEPGVNWDFFIDDLAFTPMLAGQSAPVHK